VFFSAPIPTAETSKAVQVNVMVAAKSDQIYPSTGANVMTVEIYGDDGTTPLEVKNLSYNITLEMIQPERDPNPLVTYECVFALGNGNWSSEG
jgi:hypothetical protein